MPIGLWCLVIIADSQTKGHYIKFTKSKSFTIPNKPNQLPNLLFNYMFLQSVFNENSLRNNGPEKTTLF